MGENVDISQILKYLICIFLSLIILLFGSVYASNIIDVDTHWSKQYVEYLVDKGAINGYPDGTFRPDNTVTYGEAIKLIVASYNKNIQNGDVHWASTYVQYAKDTEIVTSSMNIDENVDKPISRKEVIYMVYQSLIQYAHKPVTNNDRNEIELPFIDVTVDINKYGTDYIKPIKECYYLGIVMGNDKGLMNPNQPITRAEIATILTRAYSEEYRSYPANEIVGFFPSNAEKYRTILAYMNNSFYEYESKYAKYAKGGTPYEYINPQMKEVSSNAFDSVRKKTEQIMNALINVSYDMSQKEWDNWKKKISICEGINEEQLQLYIQYVKDNRIAIKGGALMNPCTIGKFYISNKESSIGMRGVVSYEIVSNPNKVQYITFAEYISEIKGVISNSTPQYVIMYNMYENENAQYYPFYSLYEYTFNLDNIKYI